MVESTPCWALDGGFPRPSLRAQYFRVQVMTAAVNPVGVIAAGTSAAHVRASVRRSNDL